MKVFIVLCETCGYDVVTSVEKVFLDEKKADRYAEEQNQKFHSFYHRVEEMEVDEDA